MKQKILKELEKYNYKAGAVWQFSLIGNFKESLNPKEQSDFISTLDTMIKEGYFEAINGGNDLKITGKCFEEMYINEQTSRVFINLAAEFSAAKFNIKHSIVVFRIAPLIRCIQFQSPALSQRSSVINQFVIHDFVRLCSHGVHPVNPFHLVSGFNCFRNTILLGKLPYQLRKHFLCLPVDVGKVVVHLTADNQLAENDAICFSQVVVVPRT